MNKTFDIEGFLKKVKVSDFVRNNIPLEYNPGFPIVRASNDKTFLVVPFLKYKITGVVDKTEVYPIRYCLTYILKPNTAVNYSATDNLIQKITSRFLSNAKLIRFEDLRYNEKFTDLQFDKPVGLFRHESIKELNKKEYDEKRKELFELYNLVLNEKLYGTEFLIADHIKYKHLLCLLLEPSLKYMYKMIDEKFYEKYLN